MKSTIRSIKPIEAKIAKILQREVGLLRLFGVLLLVMPQTSDVYRSKSWRDTRIDEGSESQVDAEQ